MIDNLTVQKGSYKFVFDQLFFVIGSTDEMARCYDEILDPVYDQF